MKRTTRTPPFRGPRGGLLRGSTAEAGYIELGGVAQWVMTRGEETGNEPLVILHGGPGSATRPSSGCATHRSSGTARFNAVMLEVVRPLVMSGECVCS